jgi:multiple sugar transport system ATP-binding protein
MRTEIKALHQRLRTTSVYVTHDQVEAMTMADRIVVMHDGIIEQIGSPLELYDHPANLFVAGFIGSPAMNFIPGVLHRSSNGLTVEAKDGTVLPAPPGTGGHEGQDVVYGFRPEHLTLVGSGGIAAQVGVIEPTGADTLVYAEIAGVMICATFAERHAFAPGSTIQLVPQLDAVHLFDAKSGQTITHGA